MSLLPVAEAQARVLALSAALPIERVPLIEAAGRWAAADVAAARAQPAADLSAMDGYALRFAELPGPWTVAGEARAGGGAAPLAPGEAARIFTGAPLPSGADTVLVQEEAARDGDRLGLAGVGPPARGANVRTRASDFDDGDRLIGAGEALTPARIALAAVGGHGVLPVRRRPRVALISTGDELVPPGAPCTGAMVPASNGVMLHALLRQGPARVMDRGILPDELDALAAGFRAAAGHADVIVTIGGASVGDHDLVRPALLEAGAVLDFWQVAMRPGKPLMAGRLGDAAVLGLPGNPVSAFVTACLFLAPLVAHLAGCPDPLPPVEVARLGAPLPAAGERATFLRAILRDGMARPAGGQDSAALGALARADALIVRPARAKPASPGDPVEVIRIA